MAYIYAHENVVLLERRLVRGCQIPRKSAYLFVAYGEFALGLLVLIRKICEILDCRVLGDLESKRRIAFGIFMSRLRS